MAAARIDALDGPLKTLVRNASVIGKRFPRALLADVSAMDTETFTAALQQLVQRQILVDDSQGASEFVEFRHDIMREAAYGALLREHRQALHRAILEAIEKRFADRLRDWTAVLAVHAAQAQLWAKAAEYERRTAEHAADASSYAAALAACNRALGHLERLPRTRERIESEIDVRLMLRASIVSDSFRRWVDHTTTALALAEERGDRR